MWGNIMKTSTLLFLAATFLSLSVATATAGPVRAKIRKEVAAKNKSIEPDSRAVGADARLAAMRLMIKSGTKSGKLTKTESGSLTRELEAIERREELYRRSMEKVTRGEREKLHGEISDLHQRLWTKTHNAAEAPAKS